MKTEGDRNVLENAGLKKMQVQVDYTYHHNLPFYRKIVF